MAQYFTNSFADFSACSSGVCGDWREFVNNTAGAWTVASGDLRFESPAGNTVYGLVWADAPDSADVDLLMRFKVDADAGYVGFLFARGNPASGGSGYSAYVNIAQNVRIYRADSGVFNSIASTTYTGSTVNTWYWLRLRINGSGSNNITVRMWADNGSESSPLATVTATDATYTAAGKAGIGWFNRGGTLLVFDASQYGIGTGGDVGPAAPVGASTYTLSNATPVPNSITPNSVTPRVTVTVS